MCVYVCVCVCCVYVPMPHGMNMMCVCMRVCVGVHTNAVWDVQGIPFIVPLHLYNLLFVCVFVYLQPAYLFVCLCIYGINNIFPSNCPLLSLQPACLFLCLYVYGIDFTTCVFVFVWVCLWDKQDISFETCLCLNG